MRRINIANKLGMRCCGGKRGQGRIKIQCLHWNSRESIIGNGMPIH
jgi:hypothetical protein